MVGGIKKMPTLTFVTTNRHKVEEARSILGVRVRQLDVGYPELQSETLEPIAAFGARYAAEMARRPVIVEDSGLFIAALGGFPGPYSAYIFRTLGNAGVLKLMEGARKRGAEFVSVVACCRPGGEPHLFRGSVRGTVATEPRGSRGFGYDPIFLHRGRTFGELSTPEKGAVSHRGRALRSFARWRVRHRWHKDEGGRMKAEIHVRHDRGRR